MSREYTDREVAEARDMNCRIERIWQAALNEGAKPQSRSEALWRQEQKEKRR